MRCLILTLAGLLIAPTFAVADDPYIEITSPQNNAVLNEGWRFELWVAHGGFPNATYAVAQAWKVTWISFDEVWWDSWLTSENNPPTSYVNVPGLESGTYVLEVTWYDILSDPLATDSITITVQ